MLGCAVRRPALGRFCLALCVAALARPALAQQQPSTVTTVILVRHAERAGDAASDPVLSPAGDVRAQALAHALAFTRLTGIVTTQARRTQLTAAPTAQAAHLTPVVVPTGTPAHPRAVADTVRSRFAGGTVLVVGHSNTVAGIVRALGGPQLPDLCDTEFATLFVLTLRAGAEPSLVRSRYGPEDPPPGAACLR